MKKAPAIIILVISIIIFIALIGLFIYSFKDGKSQIITGGYVYQHGYKVTSRNGEVQKYVLDKSKLFGSAESTLYQQIWGVQQEEPDKYFGKEITVYGFTVKQHPLEKNITLKPLSLSWFAKVK